MTCRKCFIWWGDDDARGDEWLRGDAGGGEWLRGDAGGGEWLWGEARGDKWLWGDAGSGEWLWGVAGGGEWLWSDAVDGEWPWVKGAMRMLRQWCTDMDWRYSVKTSERNKNITLPGWKGMSISSWILLVHS